MYWSFSDVICAHTCFVAGAYNGGGRRDASVRIIKNDPTNLLQKPTYDFYEQPGKHKLEKTRCV